MARQFQYQQLAEPVSTVGERITPDKWTPSIEAPQAHWRRIAGFSLAALVAGMVLGDVPRVTASTVSVDRWHPAIEQPQARKGASYLYQAAGVDPLPRVASVSSWHPAIEQPQAPRRPQHLYVAGSLDPLARPNIEVITVDKWFTEMQRPRWDAARAQYLHPAFVVDPLALTRKELISLDKWFTNTEQPPMGYRVLRLAHLSPTLSWNTATPPPPLQTALRLLALLGIGL